MKKTAKQDRQDAFLETFVMCKNRREACMFINITEATFYNWLKEDSFAERFYEIEGAALDLAEYIEFKRAVVDRDDGCRHWWLSRRRPEKWADPSKRVEVNHSGSVGLQWVLDFNTDDASTENES